MKFKLPSRSKRSEADSQSPDRGEEGQQVSCPKCSHQFKAPSFSSGVDTHARLPPAFSAFFLLDNAPVPLLLLSPDFHVVTSNRSASDLFTHVAAEHNGSLEKLHINELGIEFADKKYVTLGMFLEQRRSNYFPSLKLETHFEHQDPNQYSPQPSPVDGPTKQPTLGDQFIPRGKAASVVKGIVHPKTKSVTNQSSPQPSSHTETLEVVVKTSRRRPSDPVASKTPKMSTVGRRLDEADNSQLLSVPATLQISFVELQGEKYVIVWVNTHPQTNLAPTTSGSSMSSSMGSDLSPRSTVDSRAGRQGAIVAELSSRVEKLRDSAIDGLTTPFIAVTVNGDIAVSNNAARKFFGFPSAKVNTLHRSADWVSKLGFYDPSFTNSAPFSSWVARTFKRRPISLETTVGITVNNVPKVITVKGEPFLDGVVSPRGGEREASGYLFTFQNVREKEELKILQNRDEKLRGMFTSGVVAELRTPVAGIVGLLQLLNESDLKQEQVTHVMGLLRSVNSLLITIDDIVDFSAFEIETTKVIKPKAFNLYHTISHVSNLAYHTFSKRDVQFSVDISGLKSVTTLKPTAVGHEATDQDSSTGRNLERTRECIIVGDESKTGKVLTNLLSNAFKYTTKGYVNLRVWLVEENEHGYTINFEIKDTGIGISEEAGKTLFKPLFLSGDSASERRPTDGLGLYVTQKIVSLLNGKIDFFSTLGIGSVFKTSIPFRKDSRARGMSFDSVSDSAEDLLQATSIMLQNEFIGSRRSSDPLSLQLAASTKSASPEPTETEKPAEIQPAETDKISILEIELPEHGLPRSPALSVQDSSIHLPKLRPAPGSRKDSARSAVSETDKRSTLVDPLISGVKVMVVEDNWALQSVTKLRLEKMGCLPIIAVNGLEAIRLIGSKQAEPDIILMDLQMPLMDGYEATSKIRNASEPGLAKFKDVPIVAVTASTAEEDREKAFKTGMSDYTLKPLGVKVLKELVLKYGAHSRVINEASTRSGDQLSPPAQQAKQP